MLHSGLNLVTTVIGFGMSATFIFFICARLICGRIRASESRDLGFDLDLQSDIEQGSSTALTLLEFFRQPDHGSSGLEPSAVAAIPTMKYSHGALPSEDDAQCSICLGEYEEKEMLRVMPTCHHNFHRACIDMWLQKQSTCPICRVPLNGSFDSRYSSPNFTVHHSVDSPELSLEFSNQWLLPSHHSSERSDNIQEISESVSGIVMQT